MVEETNRFKMFARLGMRYKFCGCRYLLGFTVTYACACIRTYVVPYVDVAGEL